MVVGEDVVMEYVTTIEDVNVVQGRRYTLHHDSIIRQYTVRVIIASAAMVLHVLTNNHTLHTYTLPRTI